MAKSIRGEVELDAKQIGQAGDLWAILLMAGYTLETQIIKKKDARLGTEDKILFTIMTEDK